MSRWHRLRVEARHHKAAMRRHREALRVVMADVSQVERECRRLGIALIDVTPPASAVEKAS